MPGFQVELMMPLEIALTFSSPLLCLLLWASFPGGGNVAASILHCQQPQQRENKSPMVPTRLQHLCLFGAMCLSLNQPTLPMDTVVTSLTPELGIESFLPKLHGPEERSCQEKLGAFLPKRGPEPRAGNNNKCLL